MAYKPSTNTSTDNDFKLATSEALFEGLKLKVDAPTSAGTANQILSLLNPTTGETAWVDNDGIGANTSLSNLSATAVNQVLRGQDGTAAAPAYSFTSDTNTGVYLPGADTLAFSTGGAERMRINNAGNVGIGTTAPGDALVISRSGANTILSLQNYGGFVPLFRSQKANGTSASPTQVTSGNDLLRIGATGYTSGGAFTSDTGRITFAASENFTSAANGTVMLFSTVANGSTTIAERMRITAGGNVAIGLTNAESRLHVAETTKGLMTISKVGDATINEDYAEIRFRAIQNNYAVAGYASIVAFTQSATDQNGLKFITRNASTPTERMRIDSAGNVLVNHNTLRTNFLNGAQSTRVSLEGTNFIGASYSTVRNSNDINGSWIILGKTRSATNGGNTIVQSGDTVGTVSFQAADGTNLIETGSVSTITTGSPGAGSLSGALVFKTNNAASVTAERMRITSAGNVGIGTSSPAKRLSVVDSSTGEVGMIVRNSNSAASGQSAAIVFETSTGTQGDEASSAAKIAAFRESSGTTGSLRFYTTNSGTSGERMRITSAGNVGIGTSTPTARIETLNVGTQGTPIDIFQAKFNTDWGLKLIQDWRTSPNDIRYVLQQRYSSNNYDVLSLTGTGVTLGTTGTNVGLTVNGGTFVLNNLNVSTGKLGVGVASGQTAMIQATKSHSSGTTEEMLGLNFNVDWNLKLFSNYTGAGNIQYDLRQTYSSTSYNLFSFKGNRIGVNNTSPTVQFDVSGDSSLNGALVINEAGADKDTRIEGDTDANLLFVDASTDRVGIGTATPTEKLEVAGAVKADEFTVTRGGGEVYRLDPHTHDEGTETGNFTINWANGAVHSVTLNAAGPLVVTMNNPVNGGAYALRIIQGATPGTVTWPASVKWPGGTAPTLSAVTGQVDVVNFLYYADTGFYYGTFANNFS